MDGLSFELKYILEYSDEKLLNYVLYLQEPELSRLSGNQLIYVTEIAMELGRKAAAIVEEKTGNIKELSRQLGINEICSTHGDMQKNTVRAYYDPSRKSISINLDSIRRICRILQIYNLPYFSEETIYNMHLLHELYHHIESSLTGCTDDIVRNKLNINCNLSIFRDISAFSFVNSLLGIFPCQITDLIWQCYFHPQQEKLIYDKVQKYILD